MRVYEKTNENFYEIVWNARLQFVIKNLSVVDEIQEALTVFRQADLSYFWSLNSLELKQEEAVSTKHYYTGEVTLTPHEPELARDRFLVAEEANKQQIDII